MNWMMKENPRVVRAAELEQLKIKVCYMGRDKVVSIGRFPDILIYELDMFQSVSEKMVCRRQINGKMEWEQLKKEIERKEEVKMEKDVLLEITHAQRLQT
jgi:threonine aldolase